MTGLGEALRPFGDVVISVFVVGAPAVAPEFGGGPRAVRTYALGADEPPARATEYDLEFDEVPGDLRGCLAHCLRVAADAAGTVAWLGLEGSFHFDRLLVDAGQVYGVCSPGGEPLVADGLELLATPEWRAAVGAHRGGVVIEMVVERVLALGGGEHPVRVGVDGRSAAGKTTFAEALAARVRERSGRPVIRAELDHFMRMVSDRDAYPYDGPEGYYRDSRDWAAVRRLLLEPLGPGGDRWYRDALTTPDGAAAPRRRAEEDAILIADGIFLQRPELDTHWDLRIYLEVGPAESLRRAVERDRRWMGSAAEAEARHRRLYQPGEQRYLAEVGPRERAQVVIDNRDPGRPMIIRP